MLRKSKNNAKRNLHFFKINLSFRKMYLNQILTLIKPNPKISV